VSNPCFAHTKCVTIGCRRHGEASGIQQLVANAKQVKEKWRRVSQE
jgi:hypothetical protein